MKKTQIDGMIIAKILEENKIRVKSKTKGTVTVQVDGDRGKAVKDLTTILGNLGAVYDPKASGSSIGAVMIGRVKVLIKSNVRTNTLRVEALAMAELQNAILSAVAENGGNGITIEMQHRRVSGIVGVKNTPGTPKSDFHCVDKNGKDVLWISHKKGSRATDFQQWSGLTEKEMISNPIVNDFAALCKAEFGEAIKSAESLAAHLPDNHHAKELKLMACYGTKAPTRNFGVNCVDVLIQGDPKLKKKRPGVYVFDASGDVHYYPHVPGGDLEPVLAMIYKGDRTNLGIRGGRASVYPKKGRKFKKEVVID